MKRDNKINRPLNKRASDCMEEPYILSYFIFISVLFDVQEIYKSLYFVNIKMNSESLCVFSKGYRVIK